MARSSGHDDPTQHRRRRNRSPEDRVRQELADLVADPRYRRDEAFKAHVRRQFQRVYNDLAGRPQGLSVGNPRVFATKLEPFAAPPPEARAPPGPSSAFSVPTPDERAMTGLEPPHRRYAPPPVAALRRYREETSAPSAPDFTFPHIRIDGDRAGVSLLGQPGPARDSALRLVETRERQVEDLEDERTQQGVRRSLSWTRRLLRRADIHGWPTASRLLTHYLLGSGEPVEIPAGLVRDYEPVKLAERDVLDLYEDWLVGRRPDSQHAYPVRRLGDGEVAHIGGTPEGPSDDLGQRMVWEAAFAGAGESLLGLRGLGPAMVGDVISEAHATIGGGSLQGFGFLILERRGSTVHVSGTIDFRVEDSYDFDSGAWFLQAPLEQHGFARRFVVTTDTWRRPIEGRIAFDRNNNPVSAVLRFADAGSGPP